MATHAGRRARVRLGPPAGARRSSDALPYFVALPTTSGTGSEVGRSSVISEDDTHVKRIIFSPTILAKVVFADPELTLGLPPRGDRGDRHGRAHAQHRELPVAGLPPAVRRHRARRHAHRRARAARRRCASRGNLQARGDMMMSSMMGAIAFQKDLGAVHSCAHALGTVCDLHHGLANALMIDTVLRLEPRGRAGEVRRARARRRRDRRRRRLRRRGCATLKRRSASPPAWRRPACKREHDPAAGRDRDRRHLPPDQPAAVHGGRLRALLRGGDVTMAQRPLLKIGISALLLPRRSGRCSIFGVWQDAALPRAVGRALGACRAARWR